MSLLTIVNRASVRCGLPKPHPQVILSASSETVQELAEAARETCEDLASRYPWESLVREAFFLAIQDENQGKIDDLVSTLGGTGGPPSIGLNPFNYILNNTLWNRTTQRPIYGPMSPALRQQYQANNSLTPFSAGYPRYHIQGNSLFIVPEPTAGDTIAFEYVSRFWNKTDPSKDSFIADSDVPIFQERIVVLGTIWRWKESKGLDYGEVFRAYENLYLDMAARDGGKERLSLAQKHNRYDPLSYRNVPAVWNQP